LKSSEWIFGVSLLEEDSILLSRLDFELLNSEFEDEVKLLDPEEFTFYRRGCITSGLTSSSFTIDELIANSLSRLIFGEDLFLF